MALLVLHHQGSQDRAGLAATLWPDSTETQALDNLRRSLYNLRQVLGENAFRLFSPTPRTLSLDLQGVTCDVIAFDAAITRGDPASLREAVDLYRGPLLDDCDEASIFPQRTVREQQYLGALETLAAQAMQQGATGEAIRWLRSVVTTDPFRESAQRALMEALAAHGDLAGATLAFRRLRLRLRDEFRMDPAPDTTALYQTLRAGKRGRPAAAPAQEDHRGARPSCMHLPRPISDLVGRTREITEVASRVTALRLVTLVGSGGIGKTRLCIAVAESVAAEFPDGIWFVDLAPLTEDGFVPQAVASRMGVREEPFRALEESLASFLTPRRTLLILDNCEHLLPSCVRLADVLLQACPHLRILATSRQSLGITGESVYPVPALGLPAGGAHAPASPWRQFLGSESIQLFVERATAASAAFQPTERNAEAIAQVCRHLDGIPLAIELAAARVKVMTVEQIASRLNDRFQLLTGGSSTALPRHQTLRACTDWSYELLTPPERALFRWLSVFAGGWTLEAAESVCAGIGAKSGPVVDLLSALIDKSLVAVEAGGSGETRYRLLETIRGYAEERLRESGDVEEPRRHHLEYFSRLAESAGARFPGQDQTAWFDRLETEQDNLRAAFRTALGRESSGDDGATESAALRLCGALRQFWEMRGHAPEGQKWCAAALGQAEMAERTLARADALNCAGALAAFRGKHALGRAYLEEGLAIYRDRDHRTGVAQSLTDLGNVMREMGDEAATLAYYEESLRLCREIGHRPGIAALLSNLGLVAQNRGDYRRAQSYYEESLSLRRAMGDQAGIGASVHGLGLLALRQNEREKARRLFAEALEIYRQVGDRAGIAWLFNDLGFDAYRGAEYEAARTCFLESLAVFQAIGAPLGIACCLDAFADLAAAVSKASVPIREAEVQRAISLWGAAERLRDELGTPLTAGERTEREQQIAWARSALGEAAFVAAYDVGGKMMVDQAAAFAARATPDADRVNPVPAYETQYRSL